MRTSRRLGADSIESISGSDIMQFFGFNLVLFLDLFLCLLVDVVSVLPMGVFSTTSDISLKSFLIKPIKKNP